MIELWAILMQGRAKNKDLDRPVSNARSAAGWKPQPLSSCIYQKGSFLISFSVWFILLSIIFSRLIHVVTNDRYSFFLKV